ncbi:ArnT family glycosyltransferase [Dyella psychrodurans]|uniref:Glycosyltransferase family 39 protein n=1 Tax=Dyella psychrodurans TaxID=1927960 RepID=A0A370X0U8_9GAMM|nr:glycosyltransferase family 39 protein [Dyella psychrodurans]RDS82024.1 glycosyltransferase family 39 protein [Dyella psychrodurans]
MSSPSHAPAARWSLLWLLALGLLLGFAFQGTRGLYSPDEGRYVDAALEMLDSGNYLAPAYSPDEVNFSKPPTTYWFIAASFKLFGRNTWAARVPYGLAFLATLLLIYGMGKRLVPDKPWLPALIYACSIFPFMSSNIISTDVFLALCEAVAMLGFVGAAFGDDEGRRKRNVLLMWIGWGLAFLTKGPPGLMPLLAVIPFIASRDGWRGLRRFFPLAGIVLFLAIGLSWYLVVILRYQGLLQYFLQQEVYNRLFTGAHHRHAGFFGWIVVYVPTLVLGIVPWWPGLVRGIRCALSEGTWKTWKNTHSAELFLLMWFVIPLVVFCLVQSRLPLYVLPLFIPLSLLLALEIRERVDLGKVRQRVWLGAWIVLLLAVKGVAAFAWHPPVDNRDAARELATFMPPEHYRALVFVEDTDQSYTIEEATPWGVRLYLDKPVYGIPWRAPQAAAGICHALRTAGSTLVIVDADFKPEDLKPALALCPPSRVTPLGAWRGQAVEWIQM